MGVCDSQRLATANLFYSRVPRSDDAALPKSDCAFLLVSASAGLPKYPQIVLDVVWCDCWVLLDRSTGIPAVRFKYGSYSRLATSHFQDRDRLRIDHRLRVTYEWQPDDDNGQHHKASLVMVDRPVCRDGKIVAR